MAVSTTIASPEPRTFQLTGLFENPLPIITVGLLTTAILLGGLVKTGRFGLLYASGATLVVTLALVIAEWLVVTRSEEVEATLAQISTDLEHNNLPAVLGHISASSNDVYSDAQRILPCIVVKRVKIKRNLTIEIGGNDTDPTATARFNVVIVASEKKGLVENQHSPWFFVVDFRRENSRWKVVSYQRHDPREGI